MYLKGDKSMIWIVRLKSGKILGTVEGVDRWSAMGAACHLAGASGEKPQKLFLEVLIERRRPESELS